ncbi:GFA family protein [Nocardia gipuzkoensis]
MRQRAYGTPCQHEHSRFSALCERTRRRLCDRVTMPARCRDEGRAPGVVDQQGTASDETTWCPARRSDVNGGCLCGNIRFSATGDPDFPHLCSCEHCQRLSGAPVMSCGWPR